MITLVCLAPSQVVLLSATRIYSQQYMPRYIEADLHEATWAVTTLRYHIVMNSADLAKKHPCTQ